MTSEEGQFKRVCGHDASPGSGPKHRKFVEANNDSGGDFSRGTTSVSAVFKDIELNTGNNSGSHDEDVSAACAAAVYPPQLGEDDDLTSWACDGEWKMHPSGEWLYSTQDKLFFHPGSQSLFYFDNEAEIWALLPGTGCTNTSNESKVDLISRSSEDHEFVERNDSLRKETHSTPGEELGKLGTSSLESSQRDSLKNRSHTDYAIDGNTNEAENAKKVSDFGIKHDSGFHDIAEASQSASEKLYSEASSSSSDADEDFLMDIERDVEAGTYAKKALEKDEMEDFHVTSCSLPLNIVANVEAVCHYYAVFDGHGGSGCAKYASERLHHNIMSVFRQSIEPTKKRRSRQPHISHKESCEVEALVHSIKKGFQMTDNNYLLISRKTQVSDGSTACVVLLYGPDEDGTLKLISANLGDSGALMCRGGKSLRLTHPHKPNDPIERKRIEAHGGKVKCHMGIWRVLHPSKNFGLSTSRALGDLHLKEPDKMVSWEPDVSVFTIDFDQDLFMVLFSDGVGDFVSEDDMLNKVYRNLQSPPDEAAKSIVEEADLRKSMDDKTCVVVLFKWNKQLFSQTHTDPYTKTLENEGSPGGGEKIEANYSSLLDSPLKDKKVGRYSPEGIDTSDEVGSAMSAMDGLVRPLNKISDWLRGEVATVIDNEGKKQHEGDNTENTPEDEDEDIFFSKEADGKTTKITELIL